jgi:hypothetical protein
LQIAECGLKKESKESEICNPKSEITGPMLSAGNVLAPGPQEKAPQKKKRKKDPLEKDFPPE